MFPYDFPTRFRIFSNSQDKTVDNSPSGSSQDIEKGNSQCGQIAETQIRFAIKEIQNICAIYLEKF